jgi:hypothetical protein
MHLAGKSAIIELVPCSSSAYKASSFNTNSQPLPRAGCIAILLNPFSHLIVGQDGLGFKGVRIGVNEQVTRMVHTFIADVNGLQYRHQSDADFDIA